MTWQAAYVVPGAGREPYRFVPEASRRARGFAVWAAFRELGRSGIAAMIEHSCDNAQLFADLLGAEPGVAILNEVCLNQVLVRFDDSDERTRAVIAAVQAGGETWLSGSLWQGRATMRLSASNWSTTPADVERSATAILAAHRSLRG